MRRFLREAPGQEGLVSAGFDPQSNGEVRRCISVPVRPLPFVQLLSVQPKLRVPIEKSVSARDVWKQGLGCFIIGPPQPSSFGYMPRLCFAAGGGGY